MTDRFRALAIYGEDSPDLSFLCYHGSVRRNVGMRRDIEIGMVIHRRMKIFLIMFFFFTHLALPLAQFEILKLLSILLLPFLRDAQVPSESYHCTVYHYAIYFLRLAAIPML